MRFNNSLKDALTWRFVVVALLPLLIISLISFNYFAKETELRLTRENFSLAESVSSQVLLELRNPSIQIRDLAYVVE